MNDETDSAIELLPKPFDAAFRTFMIGRAIEPAKEARKMAGWLSSNQKARPRDAWRFTLHWIIRAEMG